MNEKQKRIVLCNFPGSGKNYAYFTELENLEPGDRVDVLDPRGETKSIIVSKVSDISPEESKWASKTIIGLTPEKEETLLDKMVAGEEIPPEEVA